PVASHSRVRTVAPCVVLHVPPPTLIYTLSLHDALPILHAQRLRHAGAELVGLNQHRDERDHVLDAGALAEILEGVSAGVEDVIRSEEHTSELQSRENLVCRLLLEKKNKPDR